MRHPAVDAYIEGLNENQRLITEILREIITSENPQIEERFSYKIPFYRYRKSLCYINPRKHGAVDLGFLEGHLIKNIKGFKQKGRKLVKTFSYYTPEDVDEYLVRFIIQEAIKIQSEM